jgi:tRNA(Ile)-lysidine synthase
MASLPTRISRALRDDCRVVAGDRVAVAISGGSDSVALFWLLHELAPDFGFELAGLVHVNHQLRGAESDGDEVFCRRLADRMALPIAVASVDVAADAASRHVSMKSRRATRGTHSLSVRPPVWPRPLSSRATRSTTRPRP